MKSVEELPVLILGYMRMDGILRCLKTCHQSGIKNIYISIDGAKSLASKDMQREGLTRVLEYAESCDISIKLRQRHSNAGLAVAVIEGISWFFEQEEFGVILEDDLIISPDFFQFSLRAYEKFGDHVSFALISGNNFLINEARHEISAVHYPLIWGWATKRSIWLEFTESITKPLWPRMNCGISFSVNAFWWTAAKQSRLGLVDSWAMSFSHFVRMRNLVCVLPPVNLVSNCGSDENAVHSNSSDNFLNFPIGNLDLDLDWLLPSEGIVSAQDQYVEEFIFRISKRSCFSPLKFFLINAYTKMFKKKVSLEKRLNDSREKADFSVTHRRS